MIYMPLLNWAWWMTCCRTKQCASSLIEQAAEFSISRMRRKEANNKLKGTAQDLERVKDILLEIESNMKVLEQQARRAKKYRN